MAFVDPVQHAEAMAKAEAECAPMLNDPGISGAVARGFSIQKAFHDWMSREIERGTAQADVCMAVAGMAGGMMGTCVHAAASTKPTRDLVLAVMLNGARGTALMGLEEGNHYVSQVHPGMRS